MLMNDKLNKITLKSKEKKVFFSRNKPIIIV